MMTWTRIRLVRLMLSQEAEVLSFLYCAVDHPCPSCHLIIKDHSSYKKHVMSHGLTPSYQCGACNRKFESIFGVAAHHKFCSNMQQRTSPSADSPATSTPQSNAEVPLQFACTECSRMFSTRTGLALHRKRTHPIEFNSEIPTLRTKPRWST